MLKEITSDTWIVTGAAGFIGMHTCLSLLNCSQKVIGIDNLNDYYDVTLKINRLSKLKKYVNFDFFKIDISNNSEVERIFKLIKPKYVIHLAAQAGVRYSIDNPRTYIESNIQGFLNILEGCRYAEVKHLVYASSSSVYGGNTRTPFNEHHSVDHPLSIYAASKKSNEIMAHTYSHLFNLPTTGLRFFTVYGPWGRPDMALFKFTKAILSDQTIDIYNHGNMIRAFTYIDDIVEAIIKVTYKIATPDVNFDTNSPTPAKSNAPYRIFNVGNNNSTMLLDYISALEKSLGRVSQKNFLPMQQGDVPTTVADLTELQNWINYKPSTSIETGISKFTEWYLEYYLNNNI